jgi:hypothetical protein
VYRLSRAGKSRQAIAGATGPALDDVLRLIGPEKASEPIARFDPLHGIWHAYEPTSESGDSSDSKL